METIPIPLPRHEWIEAAAALQRGDLRVKMMIIHRLLRCEVEALFREIAAHAFTYRKIMLIPQEVVL